MTTSAPAPVAPTLQCGVASYGGRYPRPRGRRPAASATAGTIALATALVLSACAAGPGSGTVGGAGTERVVVQPDTPFDPVEAPADTAPDQPVQEQPVQEQPVPDQPDPEQPADEPPAPAPEQEPPLETRVRLATDANRDKARFGEVAAGETVTRSFGVQVQTEDPTARVDASVTGDADFAVAGTTCDPTEGQRRQCRVEVTFTPDGPGQRTARLAVALDGTTARLDLTGQSQPAPVDVERTPGPSVGA